MKNVLVEINKSGVKLLKPLTPEETYQTIVSEAVKLVHGDYGSIFLENAGELERVYTSSPKLYGVKIRKYGFTNKAFKTRQSFIVNITKRKKIHPQILELGIISDMIVPLYYKNKSVGVLTTQSIKRSFSSDDLNIMKLFASVASLAIRKTQLYLETKKAVETRDLFISMAAHELKTPLTTIHGYAQLLNTKVGDIPNYSQWIKEMSWETFRLTQLVDELLAVNRIKTGKLQYSWKQCHLRDVVNRAVMDFKFSHPSRKIIIKDFLQTSDVVVGDFDKLMQVVINLLDNAAKFSDPETDILVILKKSKNELFLQVQDQGIGISANDLPKIFKEFFKGNENKVGMGLGLFLAKKIIDQHKGAINIKSILGKGTCVTIKLPISKDEK